MLPLPAKPPEPSIISLRHDPDAGGSLATYWTFYRAVASAQLERWLPSGHARILDISGPRSRTAEQATARGHTVIKVLPPSADGLRAGSGNRGDGRGGADLSARSGTGHGARSGTGHGALPGTRGTAGERTAGEGTAHSVVADVGLLKFLADESVDAVLAEDRSLSRHLVTETTVGEIARVLRPGGRVLLSVDSLMLGMAILAEQNFWAHLSDVPRAEVVLVPWPDGTITRCFWPEQLRELLGEAGFQIEWMRPRTVLSPSTVEHVLSADPDGLDQLVQTELAASAGEEALGIHLVASARKRPNPP